MADISQWGVTLYCTPPGLSEVTVGAIDSLESTAVPDALLSSATTAQATVLLIASAVELNVPLGLSVSVDTSSIDLNGVLQATANPSILPTWRLGSSAGDVVASAYILSCVPGPISGSILTYNLTLRPTKAAQINPASPPPPSPNSNYSVVALGILGQSNERGGVYQTLTYTVDVASGNGSEATISTTIANNLPIGATLQAELTGAVPTGYNTNGYVTMTVVGTWPNGQLQYASAGEGGLSVGGTLTINQQASYPETFQSSTVPGCVVPIGPSVSVDGSWWLKVKDLAYTNKRCDLLLVNGAIGSMSFIQHGAGQVGYWNPSSHYTVARPPLGNQDSGCIGSLIVVTGYQGKQVLFECTAGGDAVYASYNSGYPIQSTLTTASVINSLDYIYTVSGGASGTSAPNWASATSLGSTVTDGTITWTCRSLDVSQTTPYAFNGLSGGHVLTEGQYGFDPLSILYRLHSNMQVIRDCSSRIIYVQNGQSDVFAAGQSWYQAALTSVVNYYIERQYTVAVGFTCYTPTSTTTAYNSLSAGVSAALANFEGNANVIAGANLYQEMGSVPGSGGLYLESDNFHSGENVHLQAAGALIAGQYVYNSLASVL